jgi:hypothetical protein
MIIRDCKVISRSATHVPSACLTVTYNSHSTALTSPAWCAIGLRRTTPRTQESRLATRRTVRLLSHSFGKLAELACFTPLRPVSEADSTGKMCASTLVRPSTTSSKSWSTTGTDRTSSNIVTPVSGASSCFGVSLIRVLTEEEAFFRLLHDGGKLLDGGTYEIKFGCTSCCSWEALRQCASHIA